jgi:beta-galactosidase
MGTNAYRCAHNLPSKEILDACDEIGLIVMDENRRFETREEVLRAVDSMIKRDRNHPCVFFWSLFNEEPLQNTDEGARIFRRMYDRAKLLDDSRYIMGAINGSMEYTGMESDVVGINYYLYNIDEMHSQHPEKPVFGSENNSTLSTRGCYETDREVKQVLACYDEIATPWGSTVRDCWSFARSRDFYAGIFIWTGFDYRGEPTPFAWPSVSSQFGIMDTCGFAKDSFYFNKACFTEKPMVHLLPHWTHKKGEKVRVMAVSNCEEAELFLNGRSLGRRKKVPDDFKRAYRLTWDDVVYEPGKLEVKVWKAGKDWAKASVKTVGKVSAMKLESESSSIAADGRDIAFVNLSAVDGEGLAVPGTRLPVVFSVSGPGSIVATDNGDETDFTSFKSASRYAFNGRLQVIVKAARGKSGELVVKASSPGLEDVAVKLPIK